MSHFRRALTKTVLGGRRTFISATVMDNHEESDPDSFITDVPEDLGRPKERKRKKMFRWNANRDASLIKETASLKPYLETGSKSTDLWKAISETINSVHTGNSSHSGAKSRFQLLLKEFRSDDFKNRYASGTEEDVTAITEILGDIASEMEENKREKEEILSENSKKTDLEKKAGEEIRGAAFLTNRKRHEADSNEDSPPPRKRCTDRSLVEIWSEKQANYNLQTERKLQLKEKIHIESWADADNERKLRQMEFDLKNKELELRRDELNHKMQRDAEELKMQKERFNLEKEERSAMMNTQKLMLELLGKFAK